MGLRVVHVNKDRYSFRKHREECEERRIYCIEYMDSV